MTAFSPLRHDSPDGSSGRAAFSQPRVAIVHYWLLAMRGGERVVERLLQLYPQADLFTHVYDEAAMCSRIREAKVTTSFIGKLPFAKRAYRYYLPFMPMALEALDLSEYDLVISSESGPAKGVITNPDCLHVCYTHSPMRYIWDQHHVYQRYANLPVKLLSPPLYHLLRQWDMNSSARVDRFAANSSYVKNRIRKSWRRESRVIHPPVELDLFSATKDVSDHYLWIGEMVPYKRPDLAVDAFNRSGRKLVMVGTGPMRKRLEARAKSNITFIDRLSFADLRRAYSECRGLIFTAEEDFGIVPVEAMASGRPVLAFGRGGVRDTITPDLGGQFFAVQDPEVLAAAVEDFEDWLPHFDCEGSIQDTKRFAPERFDDQMREITRV